MLTKTDSISSRAWKAIEILFVFCVLIGIEWLLDGNVILKSSVYDDAKLLYQYNNSGFVEAIIGDGYKFRPVSNGVIWAIANICKGDILLYGRINLVLAAMTGTMSYLLIRRENGSRIVSALVAGLYVFSRFSYYQITTQLGVMEWLCTTLAILFVYLMYKYCSGDKKYYYWLVLCFAVTALAHERYLALFPVVLMTWLLVEENKKVLKRWGAPLLACFVFAVVLGMMFVLVDNVMVGTGGKAVAETTTIRTILHFLKQAIGYMFGINSEDIYLSMVSYSGYARFVKILVGVSDLMIALIVSIAIYNILTHEEKRKKLTLVFLMALAIAALLAIASVTIRVELRWIYAPYMIAVLLLVYLVGLQSNRKILTYIKRIALIVYTTCMVIFGIYCRNYYTNLYYFGGYMMANAFIESTYEKYGESAFEKKWLVISAENAGMSWKDMLEQYDINDEYEVSVEEFNDVEEISSYQLLEDEIVLYYQDGEFMDITSLMPYITD